MTDSAASNSQPPSDFPKHSHAHHYHYPKWRIRIGLSTTLMGFVIFMIGTRPDFIGMDRSPVIGFVQIAVFLIGLAIICIGGYLSMMALWKDEKPSILADIGSRLVSTGYVVCVFAGMADVFGFGSHLLPNVPYFGEWQARGVQIGEGFIAIGFLFLIPYQRFFGLSGNTSVRADQPEQDDDQ